MSFETAGTFDPAQRNLAGSGATGLIQFLPATARQLGTTTEALARMTPEEQLAYVERYLQPYQGRLRSLQDTYMAVLMPAAIGKPASHILFRAGTRAYDLNRTLDTAQTGRVTIGDTMRSIGRHLQAPGAPVRLTTATEWGTELFGTPGASGLQAAGSAPTDWGQVLFATPAPVRLLASQPARDWGQELFGTAPEAVRA
jgi:hypothetical protein